MGSRATKMIGAGLAVLLAAGMGSAQAQESKPLPLAPGETLTYDVSWSIFSAGKIVATLGTVGNGPGDDYEVKTTARSQGFASLLFGIQDEFRSVFDPRTVCSRQISKKINEGGRHRAMEIVFNADRALAVVDERDPTKPDVPFRHAENAIPPCVQDIVSAFFYVRQQPLRVGEKIRMPVNDGAKTLDIVTDVQAREQIQTGVGTHYAFRLEPKVFGQLYNRKGRMLVWFSDDEQRLPLRIKITISVGAITANLKSATTQPPGFRPAPKP